MTGVGVMAERQGFEPWVPFGTRVLQTRALDQTMRPLRFAIYLERYKSVLLLLRSKGPLVYYEISFWMSDFLTWLQYQTFEKTLTERGGFL